MIKVNMLGVKNLTKKFGSVTAIEDLTFQIEKGEIFGFLALVTLPLGAVYVLSELDVMSMAVTNLLIMAAIITFLDILVFFFTKATFQREEILTKWK